MRVRRIPAALLLTMALTVIGGCRGVTPLPPTALTDLSSLDQFRADFNAERDRARLLVLVAPT
jgi:hypothetical protein